ncbi:hypothetical protein TSUD_159700 [Trifolium subterraneum]|uniref:Uncharacterized protein n=1 Tax=Trifolium subterraneum TaxID=3900 RepID=A0A2Z6M6S6_TRISU|nr:hypothetical protein TSUD_159700 [Trifolium subterraneum]
MAAANSSEATKSIFTNYVTSPLSTEKLNGSNYDSWAADIKLWVTGQGYKDHLTTKSDTIATADKPKWEQIDAQLCSVIKSTLHPDIKPIFRPHITCESVWSQAKKLYTNETQRLYGVCHRLMNIITPKKIEGSISTYLGNVHSALHDFNELLPPAASSTTEQEKEREQRSTFFMLLALYGLPEEYSAIRDQILGSATVPDMSTASAILLRVPAKHSLEPTITHAPGDTAALASFGNNKNRYRGGPSNFKPRSNSKCAHCDQSGHDINDCWVLHGKPPRRRVNMTQANQSRAIQNKPSPQGSPASYEDFLRWCQSNQNSSSTASVAHTGNSSVCLSQSSLGPWVLDSGASDHVTGNKGLFSSLSTSGFLPSITSANGSQTQSQGIGTVQILPSLSVDSVLYDRSSGRTIGVGCESQGLYYLSLTSKTCSATDSSLTIHAQLGHPSLTKLQKLVPSLSKLSSLHSCYLINRMPSSVLDGDIPHSVLFPNSPLHSLSPRVFGSTCFVHNLSPGLDKLSARSLKCVFLGYHRSQKGYRCYSPTLKRYLVSADVTFFESIPYFEPNKMIPEPLQDMNPEPTQEVTIVPLEPCQSVPPDTPPVAPPTSQPLQTYQRRPRLSAVPVPTPVPEAVEDSLPTPSSSSDPVPQPETTLPPVIRKGTRSTRNPSPHYIDLCYSRLSPLHYTCLSSLSSVSIPKSPGEALSHPDWRQAMIDEMCALQSSGTWELVPLPPGKSLVGCRWVYTVKVGPDGKIDRFKARLVAKGYTQIFGLDYSDTFSPVAKMASVRLFLSIAAIQHWSLHQLDIKNAFLHGDLEEEVYMEQPPGFVAQGESSNMVCRLHRSLYGLKQSPRAWFGRFSTIVQQFGMIRSEADHSVFYRHSVQGCIYLIVYVDDIVITGSDQQGILQLKQYLSNQFQTKDLGKLRYFLGIEVAQSTDGIVISQRKYAMDILEETGLLNAKPVDTPMDPNVKLLPNQGEPLSDSGRYRRLVGKLNYLTVTRPDISFAVSVVSQFLNSPCQEHMDAVIRILKYIKGAPGKGRYRRLVGKLNYLTVTRPDISFAVSVVSQFLNSPCQEHMDAVIRILKYIKGAPGKGLIYEDKGYTQIVGYSDADWAGSPIDRRSTSGYCVLVGGNLISWKSKKQNVVARSSAEAEYRAMALVTCELIWLKQLLKELQFENARPMTLVCDNQAALHIASNPVFHERTKHIEIDCHFVREKIESGDIVTSFVNSNDQLADVFTKSLRGPRINYICGKLGAFDLYAPA